MIDESSNDQFIASENLKNISTFVKQLVHTTFWVFSVRWNPFKKRLGLLTDYLKSKPFKNCKSAESGLRTPAILPDEIISDFELQVRTPRLAVEAA